MKHLYFMRHGETLFNVRRRIQGWCDSPLTEKGIEQARAKRDLIASIPFDHYYCSTAERTCDTMEIVAPGKPYVRVKALKERKFGMFEGESEDLNPPRFTAEGEFGFDDIFPHYGGETTAHLQERIRTAVDEIMAREDHECVLIVAHGGSSIALLSSVTDPLPILKSERFPNCGIMHFTYDDGVYEFVEIL